MLNVEEIKQFIDEDRASTKKIHAMKGVDYYEGNHDIKQCRLFYYNADGILVEDKTRSNVKIPHPFFTELVDQAVQYILSGTDGFIKSDLPELQTELDVYFNNNEDFVAELSEVLTGCQVKGCDFVFGYKNEENRLSFQCADGIGVVEVEARFASDGKDHVLYHYVDRVDKDGKKIKKIMDWDDSVVAYYIQEEDGSIKKDDTVKPNPKPHVLYTEEGRDTTYYKPLGFVPFFRMDNNRKQHSSLRTIKDLIDDYDVHASSLTNNLVDFDTPLHVVKGFQGNDLTELQQNLKTKKVIGVDEEGGVEVHTVDIPYQARLAKLELDEKNIYRFGMGLNTAGLKDTNATTNVAIKAAYSLLDLKCSKLTINLKRFLRKIIKVVLDEINEEQGTDYKQSQVYFNFEHEILSNALENAQIEETEVRAHHEQISMLLDVAAHLDNETLMQLICDALDLDYEEIKDKLPDPEEAANAVTEAQGAIDGVVVEDEQSAEGTFASTTE